MTSKTAKTIHEVGREVVGMGHQEAAAHILAAGFTSQVVLIHGAGVARINNHSVTRLKLSLENDKVVDALVG